MDTLNKTRKYLEKEYFQRILLVTPLLALTFHQVEGKN